MEHVLLNITNPNNQIREQATQQILQSIQTNSIDSTIQLLQQIQGSNIKLQEVALTILHKNILSNKEISKQLQNQIYEQIIQTILLLLKQNQNITKNVINWCSDIIAEISIKLNSTENIFNLISQNYQQQNQYQICLLLKVIQLLCEFNQNPKDLAFLQNQAFDIVNFTIKSQDIFIQILSCKAIGYLSQEIQEQNLQQKYSGLIKVVIQILVFCVQQNDTENTIEIIQGLEQAAKSKKSILKEQLEKIQEIFKQIIETENLDESLWIVAVDFISFLCEQNKGYFKTNKSFQQLLLVLFQVLMKETDDEIEDDLKKMTENLTEKKSLYATILISFQNIGLCIGNQILLQKLMPLCLEGLKSNNWQAQHISIITIGLLVEGTKKSLSKELDQLLKLILPFLSSQNTKIIYSTLTCLGLMLIEFSPNIQETHGVLIINSLIQIINQNDPSKIILNIRGISCLINFLRELLNEDEEFVQGIIGPFTQQILQSIAGLFTLGVKMQNSKLLLEVLDFISVFSSLAQNSFKNHYWDFMDNLKGLLSCLPQQGLTQEQIMLKDRLLHTTSVLLLSNQKEAIQNDIKQLIEYVAALLKEISDENALLKSSLNFLGTISAISSDLFLPYLNDVISLCLKCLEQKVDYSLDDQESTQEQGDKFKKISVDLKIFGGKKVLSLNHSALEIQIATFDCLQKCLKQFSGKISIETSVILLGKIQEHLSQIMPSEVKKNSFKIIWYLIAKIDQKNQQEYINNNKEKFIKMIKVYFQTEESDELMEILYNFNKMIGVLVSSKTIYTDNQVSLYFPVDWMEDLINQILDISITYKQEILEQLAETGLQKERIIEDQDCYDDYNYFCMFDNRALTLINHLLKFNLQKDAQERLLSIANGHCVQSMQEHVSSMEMHFSIGYYADLIEFCSVELFDQYWSVLFNMCVIALKYQHLIDDDLYQTIFYSLGNLLSRNQSIDLKYIEIFFQQVKAYQSKTQEKEENKSVFENAQAAQLKIMLVHGHKFSIQIQQQKYQEILQRIPFKHDQVESLSIGNLIINELYNNNKFLRNFQVKSDIVQSYINYLNNKESWNEKQNILLEKMKKILQQICI